MAVANFVLPRVEGGMVLEQDDNGVVRLRGRRPHGFEADLVGRSPRDAVYLTQQIGADSGVSHALAAQLAWEEAAGVPVAHNGLLVRDLMHSLAALHAHVRHFYFQVLPDYLPPGAWEKYDGGYPEITAISRGFAEKSKDSWGHYSFSHPFKKSQAARLLEHQGRAARVLSRLQRMMALVGGKFPMVMTLAPGGVTVAVDERLVLKLRAHLRDMDWFLEEAPLADGLMVLGEYPNLNTLGRGGEGFLSAGTLGDPTGPDASFFPKGLVMEKTLESLQSHAVESIQHAFYRVPARKGKKNGVVAPAPEKDNAYSWIKAPRYLGKPMEAGALARLVITGLSGSRSHTAETVNLLGSRLGLELQDANTTGGRMLAQLGEIGSLVRWCDKILDDMIPGETAITPAGNLSYLSGEGLGMIEAPGGALSHRMVIRRGKIAYYDIISPSTWNGGPRDEDDQPGGLETALNRKPPNLKTGKGKLTASRIVQSYFFSTSDAVQ